MAEQHRSDVRGTTIQWRIHLRSPPDSVYRRLATDDGRQAFWAESAVEHDGVIGFEFTNGVRLDAPILERDPPTRFAIAYFGRRLVEFELAPDNTGGTDLTLTEHDVPHADVADHRPGWVTVLLTLKAAADFDIDLRNRDPHRTWEAGYVDV